jgi:tRNA-dihydrouridine synthase
MIGQAAIGNPRIFTPHHPTLQEKLATLLRHLDLSVACDQLFNACQEKRKGKRMKNSEITNENYRKNICFQKEELQQQIQTNLKQPNFETHSIIEFRKFLFQYVKGIPESREWKNHILTIKSYGGLRNAITTFFETKQTITIEH